MFLTGKVCLVTGGTKGIGKGIALQLGQGGATVYVTGRTLTKNPEKIGGSLEEVAEEIRIRGGKCIPIQCDHSNDDDVKQLFKTIQKNENGHLDVLVNNAYAGVGAISQSSGTKFYECEPSMWDAVNNVGLRNHYYCTVYAARMMVENGSGLIINISSFGGLRYLFNVPYGVGKEACDRMMVDCGIELKSKNVTCISLWPGPVKTEFIAERLKTADEKMKNIFENAESPEFSGKCIARLAADPNIIQKTSRILMTCDLGEEYGLKDIDGQKVSSTRSISAVLKQTGWKTTADWIPDFIKIPHWILYYAGFKF